MRRTTLRATLAAVLLAGLLGFAPAARADGGGDGGDRVEIRREAPCSPSGQVRLRVRAEKGRLRIELRVEPDRAGGSFAVVMLHERRIVFRGTLRAVAPGGAVELRRSVADWYGSDAIAVRVTGPAAESCRLSVVIER